MSAPASSLSHRLTAYIESELELQPTDKLLLAVSGGVDSVVMAHLIATTRWAFGIAHVNFRLRGAASDGDAAFVQALADELGVPFFGTAFDTALLAQARGRSIQLVARELRYEWLRRVAAEHGFNYVATAHHLNDSLETVLYNLTKGCGIRGLHGILPKSNGIVRPLVFLTKYEIVEFAARHQLAYREDQSNATTKYARNFIRHEVVPLLRQINPNIEQTFQQSLLHFRAAEGLYDHALAEARERVIAQHPSVANPSLVLHLPELLRHSAPAALLWELTRPYLFNQTQVKQSLQAAENQQVGKLFFSETHQLLVDRVTMVIATRPPADAPAEPTRYWHLGENGIAFLGLVFEKTVLEREEVFFENHRWTAHFDADELGFPLVLRTWRTGDRFQPLGMNGKSKKVSDLFSDRKVNLLEKHQTVILESNGQIGWVVGQQADYRFRVKATTRRVWKVTAHEAAPAEKNSDNQ